MDRAIEVLIKDGVFIVPNSSRWVCDLVADEYNPIVSRIGLDLVYRRACPSHDGRLPAHRRANGRKREVGNAAHVIPAVGSVVKHVAFPRMRLAPSVFVRSEVLPFGKIARAGIERCVQVIDVNNDPVRYLVVHMAGVVVRRCLRISPREEAGKRIDPGA